MATRGVKGAGLVFGMVGQQRQVWAPQTATGGWWGMCLEALQGKDSEWSRRGHQRRLWWCVSSLWRCR